MNNNPGYTRIVSAHPVRAGLSKSGLAGRFTFQAARVGGRKGPTFPQRRSSIARL
jgi:hypothetical protein